ncbi:CRISPR-associated endonuclease Cas2 [Roseiflexus sp.]|jgi:CRISPR-associated protein Cas2|uniref:CRISPR-associated endonuclease Cas2 n=1 Tax=Roseiflexus TaxID=120961 RepID=UPI0021DC7F37|nr:CRISPR-associated endonuclease Cas2 [Roseiflexus sp.]GIV99953.1 MAG: CRISPR-associated endoribonuclease Cas2 [Roseiflexus sp.]
MLVVITYDVNTETEAGRRRLHKVARVCQNYGQRVQKSVFECLVDAAQLRQLQFRLEQIIDKETDSIRYYCLGNEWRQWIRHVGVDASLDLEGTLIA